MTSAYLAVVATLLGGVLGFATSEISERNRWRRQQSIRWDETRRTLYSTYLAKANVNQRKVSHAARARGTNPEAELPPDFQLLGDQDSAPLSEEIRLVGSNDVVTAAGEMLLAIWGAKKYVISGGVYGTREMEDLIQEFVRARLNFIHAARRDLGILGSLSELEGAEDTVGTVAHQTPRSSA